ncbi:Smr domain-containing protein [Balamuthia mandrillaris]
MGLSWSSAPTEEQEEELRRKGDEEAERMGSCFERSQRAWKKGDKALAKELSDQGKKHQEAMQKFHAEAARAIFARHNKGRPNDEIDLHGLRVKEALEFTEQRIQQLKPSASSGGILSSDKPLKVIVGKGLHSIDNKARIKPAVIELMERLEVVCEEDPTNEGVLLVSLRPSSDAAPPASWCVLF